MSSPSRQPTGQNLSIREHTGPAPLTFYPRTPVVAYEGYGADTPPSPLPGPIVQTREILPPQYIPNMTFAKLEVRAVHAKLCFMHLCKRYGYSLMCTMNQGPSFLYYIKKLITTLGRKGSTGENIDVDLGSSNSISRYHAAIQYNQGIQKFELVVHGKNGVWLNGELVQRGVEPVPLDHG